MIELDKLKKLTKELAHDVDVGHGNTLDLLKTVFQEVKTPISIVSKSLELVYLNPAARELTNGSKNARVGKKCFNEIYGTNKACVCCPVKKVMRSRKVEQIKFKIPGTNQKLLVTCMPLLMNGSSGAIEILNTI